MNKLATLVKEIPYDDLIKLRKDILQGNMLRLVEERIAEFENPNRICPVCNAEVNPKEAITITFGPKGLRQRASFDGEDCLAHFLEMQRGEKCPNRKV
jgi:hypothetical protein